MKQPRVPEYREADGIGVYIKALILFLKDFSMAAWTANNQRKKDIESVRKSIPTVPEVNYPVTSVNKKTGDVVLSAEDVGALGKEETAKDAEKLGGMHPDEYAPAAQAVPAGGREWQVLAKATDADHDLVWRTLPSGLEMVKLWENLSPTSKFASQTVDIDGGLSEFDAVLFEHSGSDTSQTGFTMGLIGNKVVMCVASGYYNKVNTRAATINDSSIFFAQAYGGSSTANNSLTIPVRVYGMKGVF